MSATERRIVYQVRVVAVRLDLDYDPTKNESVLVDEDPLAILPVSSHGTAKRALAEAKKARALIQAEMDNDMLAVLDGDEA